MRHENLDVGNSGFVDNLGLILNDLLFSSLDVVANVPIVSYLWPLLFTLSLPIGVFLASINYNLPYLCYRYECELLAKRRFKHANVATNKKNGAWR
jgi:hypothetical protein